MQSWTPLTQLSDGIIRYVLKYEKIIKIIMNSSNKGLTIFQLNTQSYKC